MPEGSVELGGLGNGSFRKSEHVLDTLYAPALPKRWRNIWWRCFVN